jgi:hypothetical protein
VHCKAGRTRSATLVGCYLMMVSGSQYLVGLKCLTIDVSEKRLESRASGGAHAKLSTSHPAPQETVGGAEDILQRQCRRTEKRKVKKSGIYCYLF